MIATSSSSGVLGVAVAAAAILAFAACSRRLSTSMVSGPMVFVALGVALGAKGLGALDFSLGSDFVRTIIEGTLLLVLFTDASRIDLVGLQRHRVLPSRLLGIGLPLTIVAGVAAAAIVFPDLALLQLALIAVILAPTDAALGQAVVSNVELPLRVRQGLNVESGLNDGIAVPIFTTLTAIAVAEAGGSSVRLVPELARQIGWGVIIGVVAGAAGGWLLVRTHRNGWLDASWAGVAGVLVAIISYSTAVSLGGSGFIAAFCAGMAFGHLSRADLPRVGDFGEESGQLLAAVTFVIFGGVMLTAALDDLSWRPLVYALVSLTVVRLVPVAIALLGVGSAAPTVWFCGWFGPRGLASVLFLVLLVDDVPGLDGLSTVSAAITWTVALSVLAHGMTAVPLTGAYVRWYSARLDADGARRLVETGPAHDHALRRGA